MDENEEQWSLSWIAHKIRLLLIDQAKKNHFRMEIEAFYEQYKTWERENEAYDQEVQLRSNEGKDTHEKRIKEVKKPGRCPLDLLELSDSYKSLHILNLTRFLLPKEPLASFTHAEILRSCYVLLTIIHDKAYEYNSRIIPISDGIWPLNEDWIERKWNEISQNCNDNRLRDEIDYILKFVLDELSQLKPAETKPDIGPAKCRRIWTGIKGFFRELYGLMIERITKAYLDKYG